jgi:hypothetical protein
MIVVLLDVISTNNCVFKGQDPQVIAIISSCFQMALMVFMLVVHICTSHLTTLTVGGTFISGNPFFIKKQQGYAELASRIGYPSQSD